MDTLITVLILFSGGAAAALLLYRMSRGRRTAEKKRLAAESEKRLEHERELLQRLERIRNADDLTLAKRVIDKDPERAARVVSKLMKGRGKHGDA